MAKRIVQTAGMLLGALLASQVHAQVNCSKLGLDELNRDKSNTAYFLDDAAERACLDKSYAGAGTVKQVYRKDEFEITADDGLSVTVILAGAHGCGNLISMKKGLRVKVKGIVSRVYRNVLAIRIKDGTCQ